VSDLFLPSNSKKKFKKTVEYVVQGHRFDIFEDIGCYPAIYATLLTFFTSKIWPTILGLISAVYCGKILLTRVVSQHDPDIFPPCQSCLLLHFPAIDHTLTDFYRQANCPFRAITG
jgi:hypothetical protein